MRRRSSSTAGQRPDRCGWRRSGKTRPVFWRPHTGLTALRDKRPVSGSWVSAGAGPAMRKVRKQLLSALPSTIFSGSRRPSENLAARRTRARWCPRSHRRAEPAPIRSSPRFSTSHSELAWAGPGRSSHRAYIRSAGSPRADEDRTEQQMGLWNDIVSYRVGRRSVHRSRIATRAQGMPGGCLAGFRKF